MRIALVNPIARRTEGYHHLAELAEFMEAHMDEYREDRQFFQREVSFKRQGLSWGE